MRHPVHPPSIRYVYFDYFRAVAIVLIVIGHCYGAWDRDTLLEKIISNAITGGTALFVFISGFFFHAVFYQKFHYRRFIAKKLRNVFLPYLTLSSIYMLVYYGLSGEIPFPFELSENPLHDNLYAFVANIITGQMLSTYWFIPFIMLLYAASPLVIKFIGLQPVIKLTIVLGLFILAAIIHRPVMNFNPLRSLIYFFPFYLLGVVYSEYRERVDAWLISNRYLLTLALLLTLIWMSLQGQLGNLNKIIFWQWSGIDYMVLQKILLTGVLLTLLKNYLPDNISILNYLAKISFALFFIHPIVLILFSLAGIGDDIIDGSDVVIFASLVMLASIASAEIIRRLSGKYSRYLIAY